LETGTASNINGTSIFTTLAPTSGSKTFTALNVGNTINATGTYSGIVRGIYYNPVLTSMTGVTHRAIETTSGDVLFQSGSSPLLFVSESGNVGVGTTNPIYKLHTTDSAFFQYLNSSFNILINPATGNIGTTANTSLYFITDNTQRVSILNTGLVGIGITTPAARLQVRGSGATSSTTALRIENANASGSMVVLDNGNVGIGTTTPTNRLDLKINSTSITNNILKLGNTQGNSGIGTGIVFYSDTVPTQGVFNTGRIYSDFPGFTYTSARIIFQTPTGLDTWNNTMCLRDINVGIGTTTPSASLHISGSSGSVLLEIDSNSSQNILYVSGSGNVGIGTSTPFQKLYVDGDIGLKAANFLNLAGDQGSSRTTGFQFSGASYDKVNVYTNNQVIGTFSRDNGWGIGFSTTPSARLQVKGSGTTSATTAFRVENANSSGSMVV
jgi:hypothetical protein